MNRRDKLVAIVGAENFTDDPKALETYAQDFSLQPAGKANYAVKPKDTQEVQQIVQFANEQSLPVVPVSSRVHFYGATIPRKGGIILDLSRMNKVLEVDDYNRRVRLEAGVTWEELTGQLAEKGFRVVMPLLPHPQRSVVTDTLEREVITNTVYDYGEPLQSMEVVWPNGEIFRTGSASVTGYPDSHSKGANPSGPGLDFYRFLQAAQGTMGVVTWANIKTEHLTVKDKIFLAPVKDLAKTIDFLYRILKIRIGQECLLLNNVDLAAIMAEDDNELPKLKSSLPAWTLILVISGHYRHPEGKLKYEEKTLNEIVNNEFPEISFGDNLPGLPGSGQKLLGLLRRPWPKAVTYWKNRYKGGCQSLFFITKPELAPKFVKQMEELAAKHGYLSSELGGYIQPIEHNRACQVEFNLFYDPANKTEVEKVRTLSNEAVKALLKTGAQFTRPYGDWAKIVYDQAKDYAVTLKRVKKLFDPKNIMNPGNLCF
jgi:FAD/FMN-containing dehydrogenase